MKVQYKTWSKKLMMQEPWQYIELGATYVCRRQDDPFDYVGWAGSLGHTGHI